MATSVLYITILALAGLSVILILIIEVVKTEAYKKRDVNLQRDMQSRAKARLNQSYPVKNENIQRMSTVINECDHRFIPSSHIS